MRLNFDKDTVNKDIFSTGVQHWHTNSNLSHWCMCFREWAEAGWRWLTPSSLITKWLDPASAGHCLTANCYCTIYVFMKQDPPTVKRWTPMNISEIPRDTELHRYRSKGTLILSGLWRLLDSVSRQEVLRSLSWVSKAFINDFLFFYCPVSILSLLHKFPYLIQIFQQWLLLDFRISQNFCLVFCFTIWLRLKESEEFLESVNGKRF